MKYTLKLLILFIPLFIFSQEIEINVHLKKLKGGYVPDIFKVIRYTDSVSNKKLRLKYNSEYGFNCLSNFISSHEKSYKTTYLRDNVNIISSVAITYSLNNKDSYQLNVEEWVFNRGDNVKEKALELLKDAYFFSNCYVLNEEFTRYFLVDSRIFIIKMVYNGTSDRKKELEYWNTLFRKAVDNLGYWK